MRKITSLLFLLFFAFACEDEHFSDVPDISFTNTFALDDPEYFDFAVGTSVAADVDSYGNSCGYAGLILYYASTNYINAYDRCCPIHFEDEEQLEIDGAIAFCPSDSIYFSLFDNPSVATNKDGGFDILKSYSTRKTSTTLIVYN